MSAFWLRRLRICLLVGSIAFSLLLAFSARADSEFLQVAVLSVLAALISATA